MRVRPGGRFHFDTDFVKEGFMSSFENLRLEINGAVATITIDRPKALNALDEATIDELAQAVDQISGNGDVRGVIITGAGKAFVAGADISKMPSMSAEDAQRFSVKGSKLFRRIEQLPIPVIAAVNGFALGGGCELMLSCDFAIASNFAKFGQPEVNLGIIAGFGGTQRLTRKVPYGMAMELLMNAEIIGADEALRIGLVNRVVDAADLITEANNALGKILQRGPIAVRNTKLAIQRGLDMTLDEGLAEESRLFGECFNSEDAREGVSAFIEKRKPAFKGR